MSDPAEFNTKWDAFVEAVSPSATVVSNFMHGEILKEAHKVLD